MVDIVEIKQRVAATEEKLKSANAKGEQHSKRLVSLLQSVEANLLQNQNEIKVLRADRAAAEDEIQQLKNMLQATLSLTETSSDMRPSLPDRDLQSLFNRLNEIVANANRDFDEHFGEPETPAPDDRKPTAKPKKKPRGKGLRRIFS